MNTDRKRGRPKKDVEISKNTEIKRAPGRPKTNTPVNVPAVEETSNSSELKDVTDDVSGDQRLKKIPTIPKKRSRNLPNKEQWGVVVGKSCSIIPSHDLLLSDTNLVSKISGHASIIYEEVKALWDNAGIPTINRKTCELRISRLLKSWNTFTCRKIQKDTKEFNEYQQMLNSVMNMTYNDPEEVCLFFSFCLDLSRWA